MPWVRRLFKEKQKVWAEIDDSGAYILEDGLVRTRYTQDDAARIYRVAASNLAELPASQPAPAAAQLDLFGAPAPTPPPPAPQAVASQARVGERSETDPRGSSSAQQAQETAAQETLIESLVVPDELAELAPPPEGVIEIYTDGACQGNPGPCGYGVIIRFGDVYREIREFLGEGTNNIAELTAIEAALDALPPTDIPIRIHSDSAYSIGVLTQNWKPKANIELIQRIKRRMRSFGKLTFHKVKAHSGLPLNERVDRLAVLSIEENP